jgi:hypothetical protein
MTENRNPKQRLQWTTPELRRLDPGSAEVGGNSAIRDAQGGGNVKS